MDGKVADDYEDWMLTEALIEHTGLNPFRNVPLESSVLARDSSGNL